MARKKTTTAAKNKRRIRFRRPTAANQKRQIMSNQNQIVSIKRHLNLTKQRMRWHCGFSEIPINEYPLIIPLTSGASNVNVAYTNSTPPKPMGWNSVMTAAPESDASKLSKVVINTQWVDLAITGGSEPSPLYHTAFLVQLQEGCASQVYNETVKMTTLFRTLDYATPPNAAGIDSGFGPYLNNDRFKILKRLEFSTLGPTQGWPGGPSGNDGPGLGAAVRRTQFKINYGNTVLTSTGNDASQINLNYDEIDPHKKRFIILFSDNDLTDGEYPNVALSSLVTGYAAE